MKDRDLLRAAGEHVGRLAEEERTQIELRTRGRRVSNSHWERYSKLARMSREILELANSVTDY